MMTDNIIRNVIVKRSVRHLMIILGLLFSATAAYTQAETRTDTIIVDQEEGKTSTMKAIFKGPPGRAFLYSLILPGAGQVYNKRYWKLPIVIAAFGTTGYILKDNLNKFDQYDKAYRLRIDFGTDTITDFPNLTTSQIAANREIVRKNVQRSYIAMGLIYFLAGAEAFVDRHLMEFDISDDLGVDLHIGTTPHGVGLVVNFSGYDRRKPVPCLLH